MRFATRLNAFAADPGTPRREEGGRPATLDMARRAATVEGLTHLDLNFPDHLDDAPARIAGRLDDLGLTINGLAMRYSGDPAFRRGAFTNPDASVRRAALELTKKGVDAAREAGSDLMTLWLGPDGFDYGFQADYAAVWSMEIDGIREVAEHDPGCRISIEYKPNEPRAHSLLGTCAETLLAIGETGRPNVGVTLDFAHALYAGEQPAYAAALAHRHGRLFGVHLNDGHARRDDGLMVGAVHLKATLELLRQIRLDGYDGVLYFDTFPEATGLDPVAECAANIATVRRLMAVADRLDADNRLAEAIARQDAVTAQAIVDGALVRGAA